jgi:hypothetical protein
MMDDDLAAIVTDSCDLSIKDQSFMYIGSEQQLE